MNRLALASLLFPLTLGIAVAGPDETTQQLLSDPASMLDIGILKANVSLRTEDLGFVSFSWDDNRFYVYQFILNVGIDAEKECSDWVAKVRAHANIDPKTGQAYGNHSMLAEFFSHEGFVRKAEPDSLYTDLDRLFVLKCVTLTVNVTAPLLGVSYSVEKLADGN